jgi:ankyrin repeat protein
MAVFAGAAFASAPADPVVDATRQGDLEALRVLIEQGADVNQAEGDGMTALHWAAMRNDPDAAELLIEAGAALEAGTRIGGHTPLHVASRSGSASVSRLLLASGTDADVNAETSTGATALHFTAGGGHADVARLLLENGADADAVEAKWGQTPLVFAAAWNRENVIRVLLEHGADPERATRVVDIPERARLDRSARTVAQESLKDILAAAGAGDGSREATLEELREADAAAREVLRGGVVVEVEAEEEEEEEEEGEFDYIMDYQVEVGTMGGLTPLLHAVREGNIEAATALLDGGADLEGAAGDGTTPLLMAALNGHFDLAQQLLRGGANAKVVDSRGVTPLYAALDRVWAPKTRHPQPRDHEVQESTHIELMQALLDAGADPNVRLETHLFYNTYFSCMNAYCGLEIVWGASPFWRAAYAVDLDAMRLLVAHGADTNVPTRQPPFLPAQYWKTGQGMGALSRTSTEPGDPSGLDPIPIGGPGVFPIHAAAGVGYGGGFAANAHRHLEGGWLRAMKYIVEELGGDVNARDHLGYTPVHHAAARGDNEMIMYLVDHGADVTAISRRGQTTADMANSPWERLRPFPATISLLEQLGSANNHACVVC